jgi:hypothetical protein
VDNTRSNPSIDVTYFPGTEMAQYWTSSTQPQYPSYAWYVTFSRGGAGYGGKTYPKYVRCVR